MKKSYIVAMQPDPAGPFFGRGMNPVEFMNAQNYGHDHTQRVTKDLLVAGAAGPQVAGFAATPTSGLSVSIAKGDVVDQNGVLYETDQEGEGSSLVTMAAAHVSLPRIDLVIATIAIDTPVGAQFESFRRLRTDAELEAHLDPYPPEEFNVPTELHTRAVISVIPGIPNASPVAPAPGDGQVGLWRVQVASGQITLGGGDLTDVRPLMKSLWQVTQDISTSTLNIRKDGSVAFTGDQSMGGQKLTNLAAPVNPGDAVPLLTLQAQLSGLSWKANAHAATTGALPANTRSGNVLTANANGAFPSQDGVALVLNDRLLVKNEAAGANDGLYYLSNAGSGGTPWTLTRTLDADTWGELVSAVVGVEAGTTQAGTIWNCVSAAGGTLGTTAVTWNQFSPDIPLATSLVDGKMPHGDKAKLDAAAAAATPNALAQRDAGGDIAYRNLILAGKILTYNNLATAGQGVASIVAFTLGDLITVSTNGVVLAAPADGIYQLDLGIFTRDVGTAGTAVFSVSYRDGATNGPVRVETLPAIGLNVVGDRQYKSLVGQITPNRDLTFDVTFTGATGAPRVYYWIVLRRLA